MSLIKERGFFIPEEIFYVEEKSNTFTGNIIEMSYLNDRGKLNKALGDDTKTFSNEVASEFIMNKTVSHINNEYSSFHGIVLFDVKRELEFQISSTNFQNLCNFGVVDHGHIKVDCVIAFGNNGYPILLPINSEQYKKASKFTEKRNSVFEGELKVGHLYSLKKQEGSLLYLGKFRQDQTPNDLDYYDVRKTLFFPTSESNIISVDHKPTNKDVFAVLPDEIESYSGNLDQQRIEFKGASIKSIFEDLGQIDDQIFDSIKAYYHNKHSNFGLSSFKFVPVENINNDDSAFYLLEKDDETKESLYIINNIYYDRRTWDFTGVSKTRKKARKMNMIVLEKNKKFTLVNGYNFEEDIQSGKIKETLSSLCDIDSKIQITDKNKEENNELKFVLKKLGKKIKPLKFEATRFNGDKILSDTIFSFDAEKHVFSFYYMRSIF